MALVHQNVLVNQLKYLFPHEKAHINTRSAQLKSSEDSVNLELDVFFPNLNVCFEFQDDYHYITTWYYNRSVQQILKRDHEKKDVVKWNEIRLIVIPCWWDGTLESLTGTTYFQCPDLLPPSNFPPISLNPPANYFKTRIIPHVGELMYASFLVDVNTVSEKSWWLGEKYDGIRGCWVPATSTLYTKQGQELKLLPSVFKIISRISLDCELWFGRGNFSLTHQLLYKSVDAISWDTLRIIAFDCPFISVQLFPFEYRYKLVLANLPANHPFLILASRFLLADISQLNFFVKEIIGDKGEGVIMRKIKSKYRQGRSQSLLKFKLHLEDREGIVTKVEQKGVQLKLPNGEFFTVPHENIHIKNISVGEIVTFASEKYSNRYIPLNPVIHRRRSDISWKDVLSSFLTDQKSDSVRPLVFSKTTTFSTNEMRKYLEEFATKRFLDPLLPSSWYSLSESELLKFKNGRKVIRWFKGYPNAIQKIFSEIQFDPKAFNTGNINESDGRRKVFENYAKDNNFDPLIPDNWHNHPRAKILAVQETLKIVQNVYGNNLSQALISLFPEIDLDRSKFWDMTWRDPKKRRRRLEKYANENNFDPLQPDQWYSQSRKKIRAFPGMRGISKYHRGNIVTTIMDLFPEIGLHKSKFNKSYSHWREPKARRKFFENFAKKKGFDPLNPDNWYAQSFKEFMLEKGFKGILVRHGESFIKALMDLFPEIGLEKSSFNIPNRKSVVYVAPWREKSARRQFFETFANEQAFDPLVPHNWYSRVTQISNLKSVKPILFFYNGSVTRALLELFPDIGLHRSGFQRTSTDNVIINNEKE